MMQSVENHPVQAVVAGYEATATEVLPVHYSDDRCVNATAVCVEVMRLFGLNSARAMSVDAELMNSAYYELQRAGERSHAEWHKRGAWKVELTKDPRKHGWTGHVVTLVDGFLIDSAASQMSRPHKQMPAPEVLVLPIPAGFDQGQWALFRGSNGAVLRYRARPNDLDFLELPGFTNSVNRRVARTIADRMLGRLSHPNR